MSVPGGEDATMSNDILKDLRKWHDQLVLERDPRKGEWLEIEIDCLKRAIAEITRLRLTAPS